MRSILFLVGGFFLALSSFAQTQEERIRDYELQRMAADQRELSMQLDSAIYFSDAGEYSEADGRFRQLLKLYKSIPSDLVYYFGKNSYYLENYKQAVDWLNKYIQLKGTTGQHSDDAVRVQKLAEAEIVKMRKIQSQEAAQVLSRDYDIDCGATGKITCPVCKGSTVVVKKSYIGETYKTCPFCNKHGFLSCEEYNQLLRGELQPNATNN